VSRVQIAQAGLDKVHTAPDEMGVKFIVHMHRHTLTTFLKVLGLRVVPLCKQKNKNECGAEGMGFDPQKG
jgi:hypothetical protein